MTYLRFRLTGVLIFAKLNLASVFRLPYRHLNAITQTVTPDKSEKLVYNLLVFFQNSQKKAFKKH